VGVERLVKSTNKSPIHDFSRIGSAPTYMPNGCRKVLREAVIVTKSSGTKRPDPKRNQKTFVEGERTNNASKEAQIKPGELRCKRNPVVQMTITEIAQQTLRLSLPINFKSRGRVPPATYIIKHNLLRRSKSPAFLQTAHHVWMKSEYSFIKLLPDQHWQSWR